MSTPQTAADLQARAETLAATRERLAALLRELQAQIERDKGRAMPAIKRAARSVAAEHNRLADAIRANAALFTRPRTQIAAGLRYGLQKRRGKMTWGSDAQVIERIKRLAAAGEIAGDQIALLIQTTEKPVAKALESLDGRLLKKLGVTVEADCDEVLIKSVDGEVEKAVNAVIKDVTRDENAEVAA